VLGIQRGTQPGLMIYMLPLGKGVSKAVTYHGWGTPYDSFWCCYGTGKLLTTIHLVFYIFVRYKSKINFEGLFLFLSTGIESFSKLGDSIYFQEDGATPALYVTQYISSSLDWKSAGLSISQKVNPVVSWDPYMRVTFTLSSSKVVKLLHNLMQHVTLKKESDGSNFVAGSGEGVDFESKNSCLD